jgi:RimJ/RimL family protein N-acetyltransferase
MEPLVYLHLQLRLEGKEIIGGHFLRQVEVVPNEEVPLILLTQLAGGEIVAYYKEALCADLQKELTVTPIAFPNVDPLIETLNSYNIHSELGHYKTYIFPSQPAKDADVICLSGQDPSVKAFQFDGMAEQVYALTCDSKLVSACVSTRENEKCGEAWVYTAPAYRKQGFAQKVVNTWASSLMDAGKVPFYSHAIDNTASASLAKKLGLQLLFEEICISQS